MSAELVFLGIYSQIHPEFSMPGMGNSSNPLWKIWESSNDDFVAQQICCNPSEKNIQAQKDTTNTKAPQLRHHVENEQDLTQWRNLHSNMQTDYDKNSLSIKSAAESCPVCGKLYPDPLVITAENFFEQYRIAYYIDITQDSTFSESTSFEDDLERETLSNRAERDHEANSCAGQISRTSELIHSAEEYSEAIPEQTDEAYQASLDIEEKMHEQFNHAVARLRNERFSAIRELRGIIESPGPFYEEQKDMFTEFGRILRKRKIFDLAIICHRKAMELAPDDEHVIMNLARVLYDIGDVDKAREYLLLAVKVNPDFSKAHEFLLFLNTDSELAKIY